MNFDANVVGFGLTIVFSFLIGLEVKTYNRHISTQKNSGFFGTTRTLTFIGVLGYIFYKIDPTFKLYISGFLGYTLLYALFYTHKLKEGKSSVLLYLVSLLIYSFGPLVVLFPLWMATFLFVVVIFVLNAKGMIERVSESTDTTEFETMGKMVLLSGVILPLLPDKQVSEFIPLSPFKIWMAVVIISAISYGGYIVQKYLFPNRGYFLTGLIGGLYSSTATTVVLAKKIASTGQNAVIDAGIVASTSMMYLRLIVVAAIFNASIAKLILLPFAVFAVIGFSISFIFLGNHKSKTKGVAFVDHNPLELGTALLFAFLFVVMMSLTTYVTEHYGLHGLQILSFITGLTDIDPFILSLLTGKYSVGETQIVAAILIAAGSNNLLKGIYTLWFAGAKMGVKSAISIILLGIGTISWALGSLS